MNRKIKDPGIGNTSAQHVQRLINDRGGFNINHVNKPRKFSEAYNYLIGISWTHFFCLTFLAYCLVNVFFAAIYFGLGIQYITTTTGNAFKDFLNAFFFSSQTFTTLGYGAMAPKSIASGILSSIEAFIGLMFFAFATGLLYGRFSKPRAAIRFTKHMVLQKYDTHKSLMFRIANDRMSTMIKPKVTVTLKLTKLNKKGVYTNNFYTLKLERDAINYLPTTWTIVHKIDEKSPLYNIPEAALTSTKGELIVLVSYYDESFNQEVYQMYSYMLNTVKINYTFVKAYYYNAEGEMMLDHKLFNAIETAES